MSQVPNAVIALGTSNEVTIQSIAIDENITKLLTLIKPPQTTANRTDGPKTNRVVDLLRIEERFEVTGHVEYTDRAKIRAIIKAGGSFTLDMYGEQYTVNSDRMQISFKPSDSDTSNTVEDFQFDVKISFVAGEDI